MLEKNVIVGNVFFFHLFDNVDFITIDRQNKYSSTWRMLFIKICNAYIDPDRCSSDEHNSNSITDFFTDRTYGHDLSYHGHEADCTVLR